MNVEILILRVVHILGGIIWVGTGVFMSFYLIPAVTQAGPIGAQVMSNLQKRKLMVVLPIIALLTILSGLRLMMIVSAGFGPGYFSSGSGRTYAISAIFAITALVIGVVVSRPAHMKLAKLSLSAVSDKTSKELIQTEIKALHTKATMSSAAATVLIILSALGMAIARYM